MHNRFFIGLACLFFVGTLSSASLVDPDVFSSLQKKQLVFQVTSHDEHYASIGLGMHDKLAKSTNIIGISGTGLGFIVKENKKAEAFSLKGLKSNALRSCVARSKKSAQWCIDRTENKVYTRAPQEDWKPFSSSILATKLYAGFDDMLWAIGASPFYLYYRKESTKDDWKAVTTASPMGSPLAFIIGAFSASLLDVSAYAVSAEGYLLKVNQQKNAFEKIIEKLPDDALFQDIAVMHGEMVIALSAKWNVYRKYTGKKGDQKSDWAQLIFTTSKDGGKTTQPLENIQQIVITPERKLFLRGGVAIKGVGDVIEWPIYHVELPEVLVAQEDVFVQHVPALTSLSERLSMVALAGDSAWEADQHECAGLNVAGQLLSSAGKVGAAWKKNKTPGLSWFTFIKKDGPESGIGFDGKVYRRNIGLKKEWEVDPSAPENALFASMGYSGDLYLIAQKKGYLKKRFATSDEVSKKWESLGDLNIISIGVAQVDNDGTVLAVGLDGKLYYLNASGKGWTLMLERLPENVSFKHIVVVDKNTFFAVGENNRLYRNYSETPGNQTNHWTKVRCISAFGQAVEEIQHVAVTPRGFMVVLGAPKVSVTAGTEWSVYYGKIDLKCLPPRSLKIPSIEHVQKNKRDADSAARARGLQVFNSSVLGKKTTITQAHLKKTRRFSHKSKALVS